MPTPRVEPVSFVSEPLLTKRTFHHPREGEAQSTSAKWPMSSLLHHRGDASLASPTRTGPPALNPPSNPGCRVFPFPWTHHGAKGAARPQVGRGMGTPTALRWQWGGEVVVGFRWPTYLLRMYATTKGRAPWEMGGQRDGQPPSLSAGGPSSTYRGAGR